jgi:hypothetical protein
MYDEFREASKAQARGSAILKRKRHEKLSTARRKEIRDRNINYTKNREVHKSVFESYGVEALGYAGAVEVLNRKMGSPYFQPITSANFTTGRQFFHTMMSFSDKIRIAGLDTGDGSTYSAINGSARMRFINRVIDKSDPDWRKKNMIEVYELASSRTGIQTRTQDYMFQHFRPFLINCNEDGSVRLETLTMSIYDQDVCALYDYENNAYVVDNINDIIKYGELFSRDGFSHMQCETPKNMSEFFKQNDLLAKYAELHDYRPTADGKRRQHKAGNPYYRSMSRYISRVPTEEKIDLYLDADGNGTFDYRMIEIKGYTGASE